MTDNPNHIERQWRGFEAAVAPEGAGSTQRAEMRKAFFAGAATLYGHLTSRLSDDDEPTEAEMQMMGEIAEELDAFSESILPAYLNKAQPKGRG